jgi:hypothetical protein
MSIDPTTLAELQAATNQLLTDAQALNALLTTTPPPPPPSGSGITAPTTATITDGSGAVWGFGPNESGSSGYPILRNGSQFNSGFGVYLVIDANGVAWTQNAQGEWWMSTATGWQSETSGPTQ